MSKKRIHYLCEGRIEKVVPQDHRLSSFCKPCDAKRRDRFFNPTLTLMMDPYIWNILNIISPWHLKQTRHTIRTKMTIPMITPRMIATITPVLRPVSSVAAPIDGPIHNNNSMFNRFKPNKNSHSYQLDQFISITYFLLSVYWIIFKILIEHSLSLIRRHRQQHLIYLFRSALLAHVSQKGRLDYMG